MTQDKHLLRRNTNKKIYEIEKKAIETIIGSLKSNYLDIGSFDGVSGSLTYDLALSGWFGILCEPTPYTFKKLQSNYQNIKCDLRRVAIVPDWHEDGKADMFDYVDLQNSIGSGCSSLDISTAYKSGIEFCENKQHTELYSTTVMTVKISKLLKKINHNLDFVKIDAEGYSINIMRSWPFIERRPNLFVVEWDDNEDQESITYFMKNNGYTFKPRALVDRGNLFFVKDL